MDRLGTVLVALILFTIFSLTAEHFLTVQNMQNILRQMAITSILDLDTLLKIVVEHVVDLLDVDAADILLYENPTLGLSYSTGQGFHAQVTEPARLREAFGQARQPVVEQRKVYIPDVRQHPLTSRVLHDWLEEEGFVSYLAVPLEARGRILGVMEIFLRKRMSLDQDWVNFMDTLARQTATAIENTSLVEDLQRGQLELTLAYDKGRPDRHRILRIALTPWCHVDVDTRALAELSEETPAILGAALAQSLLEERMRKGK